MKKIKRKWDAYVSNAEDQGIDVTEFCDEECATDCFTDVTKSKEQVSSLLLDCMIKDC